MLEEAKVRTRDLQARMKDMGIRKAVFTDESSIAYLAGFWGYLGIEFGRPTMLVVDADEAPVVITPLMESEMVGAMTWVEDIRVWEDMGQRSWGRALGEILGDNPKEIWIERNHIPAIVRNFLDDTYPGTKLADISPVLGSLRVIKAPLEISVMKEAGEIAGAMMTAAHDSLREGAQEYESALAVIEAGSRKAATFLTDKGWDKFVSPMIHNLQILQSGADTSMVHRRASVKAYEKFDPVYFCFCNMAQFKQYKLGFDRMFHIVDVTDQARDVQEAAIAAQQAAIAAIKPGVKAEDVAEAANEVYRARGYETGYRTGRSIGVSYLEAPELKAGDKTVLQPGMTFAVDGGISIDGATAGRIGDSVVVTETGSDYITSYPREILLSKG
ncbi:M24 family metallopeptidase [Pseudohalocynthiibacter aestuariivivens]|jgi:Xaa-Pro aminopeptidase|uniref:M24 family metallopeptidase n=1 Tax=Pseudohalocynthiibacter aestuariivivens TaxID=1591409 RepID=A0ABV5JD01_9RHOB|nr:MULTISPECIES: Xaa-Pro peptidase family protein [Pseudohalocynthiibacter]MBS9715811.1 aminopeptidase P family protein [Pseudohalocynthiibacter aestuariivivens]MCK0101424.1 Xaa-Pro peptidase family protein [Pseudohalocynthiibacter sp. F2068]